MAMSVTAMQREVRDELFVEAMAGQLQGSIRDGYFARLDELGLDIEGDESDCPECDAEDPWVRRGGRTVCGACGLSA